MGRNYRGISRHMGGFMKSDTSYHALYGHSLRHISWEGLGGGRKGVLIILHALVI